MQIRAAALIVPCALLSLPLLQRLPEMLSYLTLSILHCDYAKENALERQAACMAPDLPSPPAVCAPIPHCLLCHGVA